MKRGKKNPKVRCGLEVKLADEMRLENDGFAKAINATRVFTRLQREDHVPT